jgi:hypothetical protein
MSQQIKTDNRNLDAKVKLRLHVLGELRLGAAVRVLDLCAGQGHVWRAMLKAGVKLKEYTPVDIAARQSGQLLGDVQSDRFLNAFSIANYDAVDVDTYGEPWKPWRNFIERPLAGRMAFFLTHGHVNTPGGSNLSSFARIAMGIPAEWQVPVKRDLALFAARYLLLARSHYARILRGWKIGFPNVTYYGLIVEPTTARERETHG